MNYDEIIKKIDNVGFFILFTLMIQIFIQGSLLKRIDNNLTELNEAIETMNVQADSVGLVIDE